MTLSRFENKCALVTGAASGIGRATALRLASEGAQVALADLNAEAAGALARDIESSHGVKAVALAYDAGNPEQSRRMVGQAAQELGQLDVVANIAGVYARHHFADISEDEWLNVFNINLVSVVHILQEALPFLVKTRGAVVNTASIAALEGISYAAAYAAAKAGVIALSKSVAIEYAPHGVRVNVVCPGGVNTAMTEGLPIVRETNPDLLMRPPKLDGKIGRGEPEDIAAAFAYLASDDASFVSGSVLVIDGAQRLG